MSHKLLACGLSASLLALPYLFPILFPLAWIAFIPLFWALKGVTLRGAFALGWLTGVITNATGFYWLVYTIKVFGGYPYWLSAVIFFFFVAYSGLPLALFALLVRFCGFGPFHLFPALFWVAIEFWFPMLFPWYLANSQSHFLTLIQSADLVGPFGASFLLMWSNAILYAAIFARHEESRTSFKEAAAFAILLVATLLYAPLRLDQVEADMRQARTLSVAAIQGGIDIYHKWNMAYMESNLKAYQKLTGELRGADLVIWPESAVEAWLPEDIGTFPAELGSLETNTFLIFGARSFRGNPRGPNFAAFNSAFLADAQHRVLDHYHKQVLLAFGEYIPLASLLSKLPGVPSQVEGFTAGDGPRTLDLPGGLKAAPLICYEDVMPWIARSFVAEKQANLLINMTNDAWFGDTVAPWQHLRLAQWRAIETRRYLVRATNTGITAVIDPTGRTVQTLPTFSTGVLRADVGLLEGETLYVRFGDWFAWLSSIVSMAILTVKILSRRKANS